MVMDGENMKKGANRTALVAALALTSCYFLFLYSRFAPAYSTMDAHEYHNQARLIATTGKTYFIPEDNGVQYIGFTWRLNKDGKYYAIAPPGFPLALAAVYRLFGPDAALLLNPVLAALCVFLVFAIAGSWWGAWWGLCAAALTVTFPFLNQQALFGYAHILSLFLLLFSIRLVDKWDESGNAILAFFAGLALGALPSVRTVEVIFIPAVSLYALFVRRRGKLRIGEFILLGLGIAIPMIMLMVYNHVSFGAAYQTGYKLRHVRGDVCFSLNYFWKNGLEYVQRILAEGGGPVCAAGLVGAAGMCVRKDEWRRGVLLISLIFPLAVAIISYFAEPSAYSMRFFLPMFPLCAISCVWLLRMISGSAAAAAVLCIFTLFISVCWGLPQSLQKMDALHERHKILVEVKDMLIEHAPPGSIVIANEPLCHYLEYYGRWRLATTSGRSKYGIVFESARQDGRMMMELEREVWKWSGGYGDVFWIMGERQERMLDRRNAGAFSFQYIGRVNLPEPQGDEWQTRARRGQFRGMEPGRPGYLADDIGDAWILERRFQEMLSDGSLALYKLTPNFAH
jgi:hypothetical protein